MKGREEAQYEEKRISSSVYLKSLSTRSI